MKQRIITAVIAAALFIPFVIYGNLPFTILVFAMASVGMFEILRMKGISIVSVPGLLGLLALFLILLPVEWTKYIEDVSNYTKVEMLFIMALLLLIYTVLVKNKFTFDDAAFILLGALYVGIGFYYFMEARDAGLRFVVYALLIVWSTDSGAYFTGRKLGKHKLWPDISPKKTIEGFVGGIVIAVVAAIIMQMIVPVTSSYVSLIILSIVCSIIGQLGDLVESAIKRHYGVKDSGTILPGHGGILDRFDSLLFVLPLLHFMHIL